MTIESQIEILLDQAEPLRALPPEEGEALGLGRLIDKINVLRENQAKAADVAAMASLMGASLPNPAAAWYHPNNEVISDATEQIAIDELQAKAAKRKPGRPPKASIEGADAE